MKKFYLYHQTRTKLGRTWAFLDSYNTRGKAEEMLKIHAKVGIWKVWKIEEVWEFA